jgi:hypothetical protein
MVVYNAMLNVRSCIRRTGSYNIVNVILMWYCRWQIVELFLFIGLTHYVWCRRGSFAYHITIMDICDMKEWIGMDISLLLHRFKGKTSFQYLVVLK